MAKKERSENGAIRALKEGPRSLRSNKEQSPHSISLSNNASSAEASYHSQAWQSADLESKPTSSSEARSLYRLSPCGYDWFSFGL